jgi:hypothetical protein
MKKILSLIIAAGMFIQFVACTNEEGPLFDFHEKDYWSFQSKTQSFSANETGKCTVYLYHLNTAKITPVNLKVEYSEGASGILSVAQTAVSSVDESGKTAVEIAYRLNDMEFNKPYTLGLSIPKDTTYSVKGSLVDSVSVTVVRKLTFSVLGEGSLNSTWLGEEIPVQIQKAAEANIYKLVAPYAEGYDVLVAVEGNTAAVARQQTELYKDAVPTYVEGSGTFADGVITLTLDFKMYYPANTIYYQELGDVEIITLPK